MKRRFTGKTGVFAGKNKNGPDSNVGTALNRFIRI
jgi:hypothetical protein